MYKNVLTYRKYTKEYSKISHHISNLLSKGLGKGSLHYAYNFSVNFRMKTIQSVCMCGCVCVYNNPRQHIIKKQRHHFADKSLYCQSYGFSSSHVWMWELEHKEGWVPNNWCFRTVVGAKTLESSLDCKEIKPVNAKGNQLWTFIWKDWCWN